MTRTALITALALTVAAPAFASDQLAASLGVNSGDYTVAELIQLRSAIENDDRAYVDFLLSGGSNGAGDVTAIQLSALEADDNHIRAEFTRNGGSEVISTQSFGSNDAAAAFALRVLVEGDDHIRAAAAM